MLLIGAYASKWFWLRDKRFTPGRILACIMSPTRDSLNLPGNILGALCKTSGLIGAFHWIIYICMPDKAGVMFHATRPNEQDPNFWEFQTDNWDPFKSRSCLTVALIGRVVTFDPCNPTQAAETLCCCLQEIPMAVPPQDRTREPRFTCRVWFREALRRFMVHQAVQLVMSPEEIMDSLKNRTTAVQYMDTRKVNLPLAFQLQPFSAYRPT